MVRGWWFVVRSSWLVVPGSWFQVRGRSNLKKFTSGFNRPIVRQRVITSALFDFSIKICCGCYEPCQMGHPGCGGELRSCAPHNKFLVYHSYLVVFLVLYI